MSEEGDVDGGEQAEFELEFKRTSEWECLFEVSKGEGGVDGG